METSSALLVLGTVVTFATGHWIAGIILTVITLISLV